MAMVPVAYSSRQFLSSCDLRMSEVPHAAGELLSAAGDCRSIVQLTVQLHVAHLYINLRPQERRNRNKFFVLNDNYSVSHYVDLGRAPCIFLQPLSSWKREQNGSASELSTAADVH